MELLRNILCKKWNRNRIRFAVCTLCTLHLRIRFNCFGVKTLRSFEVFRPEQFSHTVNVRNCADCNVLEVINLKLFVLKIPKKDRDAAIFQRKEGKSASLCEAMTEKEKDS